MPNPSRTAEAKALEVPVTVQGSKIVEGTDHRELFTETTKTEIVFDNGATLNLKARVVAGQSLFLRNEITGREVLCRVVEAPAAGGNGPTDLEFTVGETGFWDVTPEQIQAANEKLAAEQAAAAKAAETAAAEKSASQRENSASGGEAHADSTLAMMGAPASTMTVPPVNPRLGEELVPAHEAAPESPAAPSATPSTAPHEEIVPAHAQLPEQPQAVAKQPDAAPEFNLKKFEDTLAALLDSDARRAKRATKDAAKAAGSAAAQGAEGVVDADAAVEEVVVPAGPTLEQRLTTGTGAVIVGVCASIVIAVCLGFIWRAIYYPMAGARAIAVSAPAKSKAGAQEASAKPGAPAAGGVLSAATKATGTNAGAMSARATGAAKQPGGAKTPASPVTRNSVAASASVASARGNNAAASSPEPSGPRVVVSRNAITLDSETQARQLKPSQPDINGNIPARIVSEIQPTFPSWAKELDVDGVVTLDAVIDEKGNVTQTKVLSGPRPLQHAAQQAIGLWIFEPARANGKPVATHMTLTVEFQR